MGESVKIMISIKWKWQTWAVAFLNKTIVQFSCNCNWIRAKKKLCYVCMTHFLTNEVQINCDRDDVIVIIVYLVLNELETWIHKKIVLNSKFDQSM